MIPNSEIVTIDAVTKYHNSVKEINLAQKENSTLEAAENFSQLLIKQYLELALKNNIDEENIFNPGGAANHYQGFLIDEYAKVLSAPGNAGITEMVYAELIKLQEVGNGNQFK
ncbi:MAG: rod-binding protein [Sphingobacteriia bacterium]|nr:rod-binding protein [Sphingobacteriia bacterium]